MKTRDKICGHVSEIGNYTCFEDPGHAGYHRWKQWSWGYDDDGLPFCAKSAASNLIRRRRSVEDHIAAGIDPRKFAKELFREHGTDALDIISRLNMRSAPARPIISRLRLIWAAITAPSGQVADCLDLIKDKETG